MTQELRDLDARIHREVFKRDCTFDAGGLWDIEDISDGYDDQSEMVPHYSTDIAAAWRVVEKMLEWDARLTLHSPNGFTDEGLSTGPDWVAYFLKPNEEDGYPDVIGGGRADITPLAICTAALIVVATTRTEAA